MADDIGLDTRFTSNVNDTNPAIPIGTESDDVASESAAYIEMNKRWELITDLLGGTEVMHGKKEKWLPRESKEDPEDYLIRLKHSELFDAYKDTTEKIGARPFKVPVKLQNAEGLPAQLQGIEQDADRQGNDLTSFCQMLFTEAVRYGMSHLFVDMPEFSPRNLKEKSQLGIRPYFIRISPQDLFGWQFERDANGKLVLTQIRWREVREEPHPDNRYGEITMEYVRVWTRTDWEIWKREKGKGKYTFARGGKHNFGSIPLLTLYTGWDSFMISRPPLYGLARMNLRHYRTNSEQCNILRFCRLPIYGASGVTDEEYKEGLEIGPNSIAMSQNKDFKLWVVEHQGNAIRAGKEDVEGTLRLMEVFGTTPFIQQTGVQSATGRHYTEVGRETQMQSWVRAGEWVTTNAYKLAAKWESGRGSRITVPEDFNAQFFNQFSLSFRATEEIRSLNEAYLADPPKLDRETWFEELKRRDLFDETLTFEEFNQRMLKAFRDDRKAKKAMVNATTPTLDHPGSPRDPGGEKQQPASPTGAGLEQGAR